MGTIVVDTNIVFSALHAPDSLTRQMLLSLPKRFVTCNFLFVEVFKHKERIFKNSRANDDEIYDYLEKVLQRIHFFNEELISTESYFSAYHFCKDVDLKDIPFVAPSIELDTQYHAERRASSQRIHPFFNENT
jgi:predicted nucleic acid-binding protein